MRNCRKVPWLTVFVVGLCLPCLALGSCALGFLSSSSSGPDDVNVTGELNTTVHWQSAKVGESAQLPALADGAVLRVTLLRLVDPAPKATLTGADVPSGSGFRAIQCVMSIRNIGSATYWPSRGSSCGIWSGDSDFFHNWGISMNSTGRSFDQRAIKPGATSQGYVILALHGDKPAQGFEFAVRGPAGWSGCKWTAR